MSCQGIVQTKKRRGQRCSRRATRGCFCFQHTETKAVVVKVPVKTNRLVKSQSQVEALCNHINLQTPLGFRLRAQFKKTMSVEIEFAIPMGGSRHHHYDFSLKLKGLSEPAKVEAKSTIRRAKRSSLPWKISVQFYNGTGSRFTLVVKYAQEWYSKFVGSGYVSRVYGIQEPIPDFKYWMKDVFSQGRGQSKWTMEIRKKQPKGFTKERNRFVPEFLSTLTEEDLTLFREEVLITIRQALSEKDYWIQIYSDIVFLNCARRRKPNGVCRLMWLHKAST